MRSKDLQDSDASRVRYPRVRHRSISSSTSDYTQSWLPSEILEEPAGRPTPTESVGIADVEVFAETSSYSVLGPLARFAREPGVTDLFVNGTAGLWVDRGNGAERISSWTAGEAEVRALAVRLIARGGRHIDEVNPAVDVRLGNSIRVHAILPPLTPRGTLISIRIPRLAHRTLDRLHKEEMLSDSQLNVLVTAVRERQNFLITGAGGSGKTTLLSAMLAAAPSHERIILIEDVTEIEAMHPHAISLEVRQPNIEGVGGVSMSDLLREALRMRPDRLVVGECRGAELRELLSALNTGHDGGAGTLHANSLQDVPARLEALGASAALSAGAIARQTVSAFDLVIHLAKIDGKRILESLGVFRQQSGRLEIEEIGL